jgi:hypothetical protein
MMIARLCLFAVACAVPFVAQAADVEIRKAGRYVLLLDADRKPVAGTYWLSPSLKIRVRSREGALPTEPEFVDRDAFPTRLAAMLAFVNRRYSYIPEPTFGAIGKKENITQNETPLGPLAATLQPEKRVIRFSMIGTLASNLEDVDLINHFYTIERNDLETPGPEWGKRVYIETLDMDLSDAAAATVEHIVSGEAKSSGDFYIDYLIRGDYTPDFTSCLQKRRNAPDYAEKARQQREGSDKYMVDTFLPDGNAFWEIEPYVAPDEQAMNPYQICPVGAK